MLSGSFGGRIVGSCFSRRLGGRSAPAPHSSRTGKSLGHNSPCYPTGDKEVSSYFQEAGFDVLASEGLQADEAEWWLDKPVIPVNAALIWNLLRAMDVADQSEGMGSLLLDF